MYFYSDKGVEGVAFTSLFQNIPIHSLILFYVVEGVILTIKSINVFNTGAGGVYA